MNYFNNYRIIIISICIGIYACAQPLSPTGGDKDEAPPRIVQTIPDNKSLNITPKKITILFDENVQINSPEKNIIISPLPGIKPQFVKKNNSLAIEFENESLLPNTTYIIDLAESITDLNENNKGTYPPFTFSTGSSLDTIVLSGQIITPNEKPIKNIKVHCTNSGASNPIYSAAVLNSSFQIHGLNSTPKNVLIFNDENNNSFLDSTEDMGIVTDHAPNTSDTLAVYMYSREKPKISTYQFPSLDFITGIPPLLLINTLNHNPNFFAVKDTLYGTRQNITSLKQNLSSSSYKIEKSPTTLKPYISWVTTQFTNDSIHQIHIEYNQLIQTINPTSVFTVNALDTQSINAHYISKKNNSLDIRIPIDSIPQAIILTKAALHFTDGINNTNHTIPVQKSTICTLTLQNNTDEILNTEIISNHYSTSLFIPAKSSSDITVPQGTYHVFAFYDQNGDFTLTAPAYNTNSPTPEYYIKIPNIVSNPSLNNVIILEKP